jgi:hydroxymethylglutaryl-CoA synthase
MIGLLSYGGFLPRYRLDRKLVFKAMGWFNPATYGLARGERTVASYDEDALTMAVAAMVDCLGDRDRGGVTGLYLGSTTLPFAERQGAALIAGALDLPDEVRTADFGGCHRAGTTALLAAFDAVNAGSSAEVLVAAADCRMGKPGGSTEHLYGDGAAAMLVGEGDAIATLVASHNVSFDMVDTYRAAEAKYDRGWEERWVKVEGYGKLLPGAIQGMLAKVGLPIDAFAKVIFPCRFARDHMGIAKRLGLAPEQLQAPLLDVVGDTGAAHPLVMLAAALEDASPGDKLLVASFGNGCDVMLLEVTEAIANLPARRAVSGHLADRVELGSYEKFSVFREILPVEKGIRGEFEAPSALSVLYRDRKRVMGLVGSRCTACGTAQYPPQRTCVNPECHATDERAPHRFSDRAGTIFTVTGDYLAFCPVPPQIYGTVDMDGGGKLFVDFTDCTLDELSVDQPVEMTFRRKYHDVARGLCGYFWKARPLRQVAGEERNDG